MGIMDNIRNKIVEKIEEQKELYSIEKQAYAEEAGKFKEVRKAEKIEAARQRGIDKARGIKRQGGGILANMGDNYGMLMEEQKNKGKNSYK